MNCDKVSVMSLYSLGDFLKAPTMHNIVVLCNYNVMNWKHTIVHIKLSAIKFISKDEIFISNCWQSPGCFRCSAVSQFVTHLRIEISSVIFSICDENLISMRQCFQYNSGVVENYF